MSKRILLVALLFLCASTFSEGAIVRSAKTSITYHLIHPMHKIASTSHAATSSAVIDPVAHTVKKVIARVEVATFDSKNSNRDSHAMEVIEALKYPEATFASTSVKTNGDVVKAKGNLKFHGVTGPAEINGRLKWGTSSVSMTGTMTISLTDHKVARPSLLMVKVEDALKFDISAEYPLK